MPEHQIIALAAVASPTCLFVGCFALYVVRRAMRSGMLQSHGRKLRRTEHPFAFAVVIVLLMSMGAMWILAGLTIPFAPFVVEGQ